jgi:hypothetical protein
MPRVSPCRSGTLATHEALAHAFMTIPLASCADATSWRTAEMVWTVAAAVLDRGRGRPARRAAPLLAALVRGGLLTASVVSSSEVAQATQADRERFLRRARRRRVDDATDGSGRVSSIAEAPTGTSVWSTAFWNERIARVVRLPGPPLVQRERPVRAADERRHAFVDAAGRAVSSGHVVAPTTLAFVGARAVKVVQHGPRPVRPRALARRGTPRLSSITSGVLANGDVDGTPVVTSSTVRGGSLELDAARQERPAGPDHEPEGDRSWSSGPERNGAWSGGSPARRPGGFPGRVCTYSSSRATASSARRGSSTCA